MWVQFETRGETGTYFTLYSVDHPDKAINKRVLMQAVNLGVFVNLFGPEVPSVFLQVSSSNRSKSGFPSEQKGISTFSMS